MAKEQTEETPEKTAAEEHSAEEILELSAEETPENEQNKAPQTTEQTPKAEKRSVFQNLLHPREKKAELRMQDIILSRIQDQDLMKYLEMEQEKSVHKIEARDSREKRILAFLQLFISLAAVIFVVFLLKDNATVLVNILYIIGIIIVFWIFKNPKEK